MKNSIRGKIRLWLGLDDIVTAMIQSLDKMYELERERSASEIQKLAEEIQSWETVMYCQDEEIAKLTRICASLQDDLESKGNDFFELEQAVRDLLIETFKGALKTIE